MLKFTYRLVHDRPNARLKLIREATDGFRRLVQFNVPLSTPINIQRLDSGTSEQVMGYRTLNLEMPGLGKSYHITAGSGLTLTLEDELTLLTRNDGSAYDFSADDAGNQLEEILARLVNQTGYHLLAEGVMDLDDATVKVIATDLKDGVGGSVLPLPAGTVGMSLQAEVSGANSYIRVTTNGADPAHATFLGFKLGDGQTMEIGQTPNTPVGDVSEVSNLRALRSTSWTSGSLHVRIWGKQ